tara:strand:- start:12333 stop:12755 length:423 start_codon:yes stop_codon:yes gene_type:complete
MTANTLRKTIYLQASRETVWAFLTQPDKIKIWFHAPKSPLKEGCDLALYGTDSGDQVCWGHVRVARAPEYLEYTFSIKPMDGAVSTVKWSLDAVPGGTRLSLVHEGLPEGQAAFGLTLALDKGWETHLDQMREHLHKDLN